MKNNKKKFVTIVVGLMCVLGMATGVWASSGLLLDEVTDEATTAVSSDTPEIVPFDYNIPILGWNVATDGPYDFKGQTTDRELYSLYRFTGSNVYYITVTNHTTGPITVKAYQATNDTVLDTWTVEEGAKNKVLTLSTARIWYLGFPATAYVSGTVSNTIDS